MIPSTTLIVMYVVSKTRLNQTSSSSICCTRKSMYLMYLFLPPFSRRSSTASSCYGKVAVTHSCLTPHCLITPVLALVLALELALALAMGPVDEEWLRLEREGLPRPLRARFQR